MKTSAITLALCILCALASTPVLAQNDATHPSRTVITPRQYDVRITNMGDGINSSDDDFAPFILGNGRVLYFTSTRDGDQNLFSAVKSGTSWGSAADAGPALNTPGQDGGATVTSDGHWMIFTGCDRKDGFGDCDLFIAEYIGGSWRNVRNLGPLINSSSWDSQPSISADGTMLVFASERPGGFGGTDLWMSTRRVSGDWELPINLGANINTAGDETAPTIAADKKTLYFSSDTHPGIGGFDIYRSRWNGSSWSIPEHAGTPLNSAYDDYFCALELGGDDVYFASNRPGGSGGLDLYLAVPNPLPPSSVTSVAGVVRDGKTNTAVAATLTVRDIRSNEVVATFQSDDVDGGYVVVLQPGRSYVITSEAPGYLFYSDRFDVPTDSRNTTLRKDVVMTRDIVRLLVYFDFDKTELQPDSYVDLDRAVAWLKANPGVHIELAGHTDNKGTAEYNDKLSHERARAVKVYLVGKGVTESRVAAEGYGMAQPVATNETDEGRAQNRRVELRVKGQ